MFSNKVREKEAFFFEILLREQLYKIEHLPKSNLTFSLTEDENVASQRVKAM